jgi:hypothetical protein
VEKDIGDECDSQTDAPEASCIDQLKVQLSGAPPPTGEGPQGDKAGPLAVGRAVYVAWSGADASHEHGMPGEDSPHAG